jgi:hypothetical protein
MEDEVKGRMGWIHQRIDDVKSHECVGLFDQGHSIEGDVFYLVDGGRRRWGHGVRCLWDRPAQRTAVKQRPHQETRRCQVVTSEPVVLHHGREGGGGGHDEVRPSASTACWAASLARIPVKHRRAALATSKPVHREIVTPGRMLARRVFADRAPNIGTGVASVCQKPQRSVLVMGEFKDLGFAELFKKDAIVPAVRRPTEILPGLECWRAVLQFGGALLHQAS